MAENAIKHQPPGLQITKNHTIWRSAGQMWAAGCQKGFTLLLIRHVSRDWLKTYSSARESQRKPRIIVFIKEAKPLEDVQWLMSGWWAETIKREERSEALQRMLASAVNSQAQEATPGGKVGNCYVRPGSKSPTSVGPIPGIPLEELERGILLMSKRIYLKSKWLCKEQAPFLCPKVPAHPTCVAVELVLDGVLNLQLDALWHVLAVCNVPAVSDEAGKGRPRSFCFSKKEGPIFTCTTVELVLDGVLDLVLEVAGHVIAVRNVPVHTSARQGSETHGSGSAQSFLRSM
eukprot:1142168-Pelagomonas_calceolata.AAC.8